MPYTTKNFKTKKALKEAVAKGEEVTVYEPGLDLGPDLSNYTGSVTLEGPHFPEPHKWYAQADVVDGLVKKVR